VRAQLVCKHPELYGPRLLAWATARSVRRGLPTPAPFDIRADEVRELSQLENLIRDPVPPIELGIHIPLALRLIRAVPFGLRYRVQCWRRRAQLGLRAAIPWRYL